MPDDLPHAAGNGDFAQVRRWFDAAGRPALGNLANHFPAKDDWIRGNLQWGEPNVQQVLDTALAWAVMNNHFEIAETDGLRNAQAQIYQRHVDSA
jgi:hypothetical protein